MVTPYTRYPTLLETLLGFLRTEHKGTIRSQTLRLLGLMGALDPYQHKMMMGQVSSDIDFENLERKKLKTFWSFSNYRAVLTSLCFELEFNNKTWKLKL